MLEFTLKFLSGESRKYEVDESTTVRQFKERLQNELNIPVDRQRLIFQGKVLQDETKLIDSNIGNKTVHFVERAEPIPPPGPNNSIGTASNATGGATGHDGGLSQALIDDVNETTSIIISNAFPGMVNLQPGDIQNVVQSLLNDLGDVGRQAQVNTTMASDGQGVDVNIDFGNIQQVLEQQEINERFRSIGRMVTRLKLRLDRMEQIVESNFRPPPTPPPPQASSSTDRTASPARPSASTASATTTTTTTTSPSTSTATTATTNTTTHIRSSTFLGMEDITDTEMDTESQGSAQSGERLYTPPSTASATPVENAATPTTNNPTPPAPRTARDLVDLMNTIHAEQQRLEAHYQTYLRTITHNEPFGDELAGRQRFYSLYNEATHLIAHINHNITDMILDLNDPLETRRLHLGELPISHAGLASVSQGGATGNDMGRRMIPRTSRSIGRRPTAVATARIMAPIQIGAAGAPTIIPAEVRMPFPNPAGPVPRMFLNPTPRAGAQPRPNPTATGSNTAAPQSMRFNFGTFPQTFIQMGPEGITLNQVSASVVADVQTSSTSQDDQSSSNATNNRTMPNVNQPGATHVISTGPIQLNANQLDANIAAEIAQRVSNSVQQHFAQMATQQMGASATSNAASSNNQNATPSANPLLRSTFMVQPDSSTASARPSDTLRSRSADSRPTNANSSAASNTDDDDSDWIDIPMDGSLPNPAGANQTGMPLPRIRGPAIIQSIDRSLPCTSPYFTQTLNPPFDNPNNATNMTPSEAAALTNAASRALIFTTGSPRPRGRHRHPAGPWAQQNQNLQPQLPNFMIGAPMGTTAVLGGPGQPYNVTAHSFEIPMVISASTTAEVPTPPSSTDPAQTGANNAAVQGQINAVLGQVLSQVLPGVLRSGNGRVRLNIGQNSPPGNPPTAQANATSNASATSQTSTGGATQQTANIPLNTAAPGVMAGGLDFTNLARSINTMVQGIAGRLIPGASLVNPGQTATTLTPPSQSSASATGSTSSATASSSQSATRPTPSATATNANDNDRITEQMLGELMRLLGGGMDNPELENLTIGSFMQRFGEDIDSRSNDGTNMISELFSAMTSRMRFTDVWNLVLGNTVGPRISEARQSATDYLRNTILRGRPITPETLDELAQRLYDSLLQEASINFNELRAKPNINLSNVMRRFFRYHARQLLRTLFDDPDNVWFQNFRQHLITMRNEYLALSAQCLEGGESAAVDFIINRHRIIFRSTNPMIVAWSENYLRTSLTSAFSSIRASPPNVSQYLTEPAPPAPTPAPALAPPVQSVPLRAAPQPTNPVNPTDQRREENATATTTNPSWQANLPEEWIPIVIRDVNAQRNTPAQPPFSDAYKEGMPPKRRRIHLREDLTTANLLQNIVLRASSASATNSAETPESVLSGEAASSALVETFEEELKRLLEQRVRQDRDYPEVKHRMPNTKRYLDGEK